ncbi:MAG: hypothetical protein GF332_01575 [Candidatus Moranbacteria bacterium]|nr:hypothetical protein [Candidatus Moranbacteria bacterium]
MIEKIKNKISNKNNWKYLTLLGLIIAVVFFLMAPEPTQAGWIDQLLKGLTNAGWEFFSFIFIKLPVGFMIVIATMLQFVAWIFFLVASNMIEDFFNPDFYMELGGFASNETIIKAHNIVTLIADMGFIVALLFIGVGTIFRVEKYSYKKLLVRLVILAFLTNFSRVFAGIVLDFTHVIMFGNIFGNPIAKLRETIWNLLALKWKATADIILKILSADDLVEIVATAIGPVLTVAFVFLATFVIGSVAMLLIVRTVAIWVLIVVSPLAYVGMILPDTQGMASKWWSAFLKYAFMGPLMLFFLWFSAEVLTIIPSEGGDSISNIASQIDGAEHTSKAENHINSYNTWIYLIFAMVLLIGSVYMAGVMGAAGAGMAMKLSTAGAAALTGLGVAGLTKVAARKLGGVIENKGKKMSESEKKVRNLAGKGLQKVGGGLKLASAFLDPVNTGRLVKEKINRTKHAMREEDTEAIEKTLTGASAFFDRGAKKRAEEIEQNQRNQKRDNANKEIKNNEEEIKEIEGENEQLEKEIKEIEDEKARKKANNDREALEKQIQELESQKQGNELRIADKKSQKQGNELRITDKEHANQVLKEKLSEAGELNENKDKEAIKNARKAVWKNHFREAVNYDRPREVEVANETEKYKQSGVRTPEQLIQAYQGTTNENQKEALTRMAWSMGAIKPFLSALGRKDDADGIKKFLETEFSDSRQQRRLASDLSATAMANDDFYHAGLTRIDPITKELRLAEPKEQQEFVISEIQSMNNRGLARSLKPQHINDRVVFEHLIKRMDTQGFQNSAFNISDAVANAMKQKVRDLKSDNNLDRDQVKKITETINQVLISRQKSGSGPF